MMEVLLSKIPIGWLLFFSSWGLWGLDTYGKLSKQFWRSYMAFMASFMDDIVGWPMDSPYPVVLTDYYPRGVWFYGAEYYTKFNISQKQILFVDQTKPHGYEKWNNPYLAISILENNIEIANMSDWIESRNLYFYKDSEYFVPLHILLLCYAYENNLPLKYSDLQKYTFSVITLAGEIETIDISGKVVAPEVNAIPTTEETSLEPEETKEQDAANETSDLITT